MASLKDISIRTGFSISVVSRALNEKPDRHARISQETRRKITEAAAELGFRRNRFAEFLKRGKTASIGVFLPQYSNRLIADLIMGMSETANEKGFPLNIYFGMTEKSYAHFINHTADLSYSGIITYPYSGMDGDFIRTKIEYFKKCGGSVVIINLMEPIESEISASIDNYQGGALAGVHLRKRRCRSFLTIRHFPGRTEGFLSAFGKTAKTLAFTGMDEFSSFMDDNARNPDLFPMGVFATTDVDALDAMNVVSRHGLKVGEDVLVIGYDNLDLTERLDPPLTTIHQPFKELGILCVKKLVNLISGLEEKSELIRPSIIVRKTA